MVGAVSSIGESNFFEQAESDTEGLIHQIQLYCTEKSGGTFPLITSFEIVSPEKDVVNLDLVFGRHVRLGTGVYMKGLLGRFAHESNFHHYDVDNSVEDPYRFKVSYRR